MPIHYKDEDERNSIPFLLIVTTGQLICNCVCLGCMKIGYTDEKHLPYKCTECGGVWISHKQAVEKYGLGEIPGHQNENGVKVRITEDDFHLVSDI